MENIKENILWNRVIWCKSITFLPCLKSVIFLCPQISQNFLARFQGPLYLALCIWPPFPWSLISLCSLSCPLPSTRIISIMRSGFLWCFSFCYTSNAQNNVWYIVNAGNICCRKNLQFLGKKCYPSDFHTSSSLFWVPSPHAWCLDKPTCHLGLNLDITYSAKTISSLG